MVTSKAALWERLVDWNNIQSYILMPGDKLIAERAYVESKRDWGRERAICWSLSMRILGNFEG